MNAQGPTLIFCIPAVEKRLVRESFVAISNIFLDVSHILMVAAHVCPRSVFKHKRTMNALCDDSIHLAVSIIIQAHSN